MTSDLLYVGTHRRARRADPEDIAFGVYGLRLDPHNGCLSEAGLTETTQPGWIALHPSGRFLYVANEVGDFEGQAGGGVSAFAIDPDTGALSRLNTQRTPPAPCHCEVDATGRYLLVATFGGGSVHLFPIAEDGGIGREADTHRHVGSSVHPRRQTQPHAHGVDIDPANRFVFVPDLGIDQVVVYELDLVRGKLIPRPERNICLAPGSGPRRLTFETNGRFAYLMNEMSATITAFAYDAVQGALTDLESVDLLPDGFAGHRSGADIRIHPRGRHLYATTRSHGSSGEPPIRGLDSLVWFEIHPEDGRLDFRGQTFSGGEIPRSFTFSPRGDRLFVAHQASGNIVTFLVDPRTGEPIPTDEAFATPVPVCMRLVAAN